jgi:hypothetical protein
MLILPNGMTMLQYLQSGLHKPERIDKYRKWVQSLPCSVCARDPAGCAHHLIGWGLNAVGGKSSDLLTMPLCDLCHTFNPEALHHLGHVEWEWRHGPQSLFVMTTLYRALVEGVLK